MKILLAGATGAIGRNLLPLLTQAGHQVVGTTRTPSKLDQISALGGLPLAVDALDREGLFAALASTRPDVVIHQMTDLSTRDFAANTHLRIAGSRNLVDAARAASVQHMIAESISWIYAAGDTPAVETDPLDVDAPDPRKRTVAAVQALEQAVGEMPLGIVLRYGILYGAGTWYDKDSFTTDQIRRGELIANDAVTSFVHVEDAASAALLALDWSAGAYNIVDDEPAPAREWVPYYACLVGAPQPAYQLGRAAWERGTSNTKARGAGWTPAYTSWRDGFTRVLT